jgi:hypothetical protein
MGRLVVACDAICPKFCMEKMSDPKRMSDKY